MQTYPSLLVLLSFIFSILTLDVNGQEEDPQPILRSIYFGGGSDVIDEAQLLAIKKLVESIPDLKFYQISITSHTDNIGSKAYNKWLSERRSEAVLDELLKNQVPDDQVFIKDFGMENPHYDNRTHQGRIRNRRVDILFSPLTL